mmetsp:Transcript_9758/g.9409  ORF Transcript_9758/g.9409 Transcript_9758/m.9409 type:complete len:216 (-) Transcript_9758:109-756(-)
MLQNTNTKPFLALAVSYYIDEDQYTDEYNDNVDDNERGQYVSSALLIFNLKTFRLDISQQLEVSTDYSTPSTTAFLNHTTSHNNNNNNNHRDRQMVALALASPTVADIDGNGLMDIIVPTSMGRIYVYHILNGLYLTSQDKFPIQMPYPIEKLILVEDVMGDVNLESFALDNGLNVICFNHNATILWKKSFLHRTSKKVTSLSGMVMTTLSNGHL